MSNPCFWLGFWLVLPSWLVVFPSGSLHDFQCTRLIFSCVPHKDSSHAHAPDAAQVVHVPARLHEDHQRLLAARRAHASVLRASAARKRHAVWNPCACGLTCACIPPPCTRGFVFSPTWPASLIPLGPILFLLCFLAQNGTGYRDNFRLHMRYTIQGRSGTWLRIRHGRIIPGPLSCAP